MSLALAVAVVLAFSYFFYRARQKNRPEVARESTPPLDAFIAEALEQELAGPVLGLRGASTEERKPLAKTLRNEPDADVVSKIEEKVKSVELEFVRYAHESDAEVTVRVRYDNGEKGETSKRLPWNDVPEAIRSDFDRKGGSRVFRTWTFPWQRVQVL